MKSCLEIQLACLEADSRFIAETHYQLGNAHLLNKGYTTAVTELRTAKSVSTIVHGPLILINFLAQIWHMNRVVFGSTAYIWL